MTPRLKLLTLYPAELIITTTSTDTPHAIKHLLHNTLKKTVKVIKI